MSSRALLMLALTVAPLSADIALVTGGKATAEIVPAAGNKVAALAAQELTALIEQSSGAKLPIAASPTAGVAHVFLGESDASAKAGVTAKGLDPEGFRLKTVGQDIHIVGDDRGEDPGRINRSQPTLTGTLSGVYELLERVVGARFYWHDALGTIVPKHADLKVPDLDVTQAPRWRYRALPYAPENQTYQVFGRRLRLGQAYTMSHGHNWYGILPAEKYGEQHPEYYALVNGVRQNRYYSGHHGGQVCTTNPEVIDLFAGKCIEYFDQHPDVGMYSISPNDGGGFCQCEQCRALDVEDWGDEIPGIPVMTDRMLTFYNAIATKVAAKHPGKYLGCYVYSYYKKPPVKVAPHPNLALVFAVNSAGTHGAKWAREQAWIQAWTKLTRNFYQYDIFWLDNWCLGCPAPVTRHGVDKLKYLLSTSMSGGYLYAAPSYESLGALHYLVAKLMWDPTVDVAALEKQYYGDLYGAAGPDVKAWYDLLEGRLRQVWLEGPTSDDPVVQRLIAAGNPTVSNPVAAYLPVLPEAEAIIRRAEARTLTAEQKERLARLRDHLDLLRTTITAYVGAERLTGLGAWDPDQVEATRQAIDDRAALLPKMAKYAPTLVKVIEDSDRGQTARITPTAAAYQLAGRAGPTVIYATTPEAAPVIDGKLDRAWGKADWRDLVQNKTGAAPAGPARAAMVVSDDAIYLFVEGWDQEAGKLKSGAKERQDLALFADDNVEWFLVPPGDGYYQVAVGAGGALYTGHHPTGDPKVKADWMPEVQSAVVRHEHGWSAEVKLPLSSLKPVPAAGAEGWRSDVFRTRRCVEPTEYAALSPTFGGHHEPIKYAVLRFGQPPAGPQFVNGDLEGIDRERFEKVFRVSAKGEAVIEKRDDFAYAGKSCAYLKVGQESLAQVTVTSPAMPGKSYRVTLAHRNQPTGVDPKVRPQAPMSRVIFRDNSGKAVTDTKGYSWNGTALDLQPGTWRLYAHTFTAPPGTEQISVSLFFHHPGEYWLDNLRIEAIE